VDVRKKAEGGSLSQQRKKVSNYKQGGIAKGCGAVMGNRRKVTKEVLIWQMVLRKWVSEKWVDIGSKRKDGSYAPCGRSKGEKRKGYPKCVPLS
jgi:hypothetical protein